jgi:hypothetical protein
MNIYNVIGRMSDLLENSTNPKLDLKLHVLIQDQRLVWVLLKMGHSLFSPELESLFQNLEVRKSSPVDVLEINYWADKVPYYRLIDTYIHEYVRPANARPPIKSYEKALLDLNYHIKRRMSKPVKRPKNYLLNCR